jgi:hypothetical protein
MELVNLEGCPRGTVPTFSASHAPCLSLPCGLECILGHFYFTACEFDRAVAVHSVLLCTVALLQSHL